jgi:hypothetical protein
MICSGAHIMDEDFSWMKILRSRAGGRYLGKMVERSGRSACLRAARQGTPWME